MNNLPVVHGTEFLAGPATSGVSTTSPSSSDNGLSAGAIAGIVIASVLIVGALIAVCIWLGLRWRKKRQLEGQYCPAAEEQKTAVKNLPPLPNPAPERLI